MVGLIFGGFTGVLAFLAFGIKVETIPLFIQGGAILAPILLLLGLLTANGGTTTHQTPGHDPHPIHFDDDDDDWNGVSVDHHLGPNDLSLRGDNLVHAGWDEH